MPTKVTLAPKGEISIVLAHMTPEGRLEMLRRAENNEMQFLAYSHNGCGCIYGTYVIVTQSEAWEKNGRDDDWVENQAEDVIILLGVKSDTSCTPLEQDLFQSDLHHGSEIACAHAASLIRQSIDENGEMRTIIDLTGEN